MRLKSIEAFNFANNAHKDQIYDRNNKDIQYITHLMMVVSVLWRFGITEEHIVTTAYLHDILNNTDSSYDDIKNIFGEDIAEYVYAVSDEFGRNRQECLEKTLPKIRGRIVPTIIRLADYIANLEYAMATGNLKIARAYRNEYEYFKNSIDVIDSFTDKEMDILTNMWSALYYLIKNIPSEEQLEIRF